MKLKELKQAIERRPELDRIYRTSPTTGPSTAALWEKIRLSTLVADALSDPTPLSPEILEAMGFTYYDGAYRLVYKTYEDKEVEPDEVTVQFPEFARTVVRAGLVVCEPQQRTVGGLWGLLLELTREEP
jgi:hypothetical protein